MVHDGSARSVPDGCACRCRRVVRVGGPFPAAIQAVMGGALIADSFEAASRIAPTVSFPVATLEGDVFRGRHVVTGGEKAESRGILATKREIKELREQIAESNASLEQLIAETAGFEQIIAHATAAIAGLSSEIHRQEKEIVGVEGQASAPPKTNRACSSAPISWPPKSAASREEIAGLDARQAEARESIARLNEQKIAAEAGAQRGAAAAWRGARHGRRPEPEGGRGARHACRAGRAQRRRALPKCRGWKTPPPSSSGASNRARATCALMRDQRERLLSAIADGQRLMDEDVGKLEGLRTEMIRADERALEIKQSAEKQEDVIRDARRAVDALRALAAEVDVQRATAESDLTHLAQQAIDTVNTSLDDIRDRSDADGSRRVRSSPTCAPFAPPRPSSPTRLKKVPRSRRPLRATDARRTRRLAPVQMTAEEAIAELREKIDRMGPVNMMAIEQSTGARGASRVPVDPAPGPRRIDRADQRGDQQDRRDHARALPRGVHRDQRELPGHLRHAVRRRQGRHHAAR